MGYVLLFIVVFVTVTLIKGGVEKKKLKRKQDNYILTTYNDDGTTIKEQVNKDFDQPQNTGKIAELNRKMEEKTAWLEADTQRMQAERARRKAAKQAEKQAKIEFKNRNK